MVAKAKRTRRPRKLTRTDEYGAVARGQMLLYDPDELDLVTDPSDPLYQPDVNDPIPDAFVRGIIKHGLKKPITLRRNGTDKDGRAILQVVDGRTGVRGTRLANQQLRKAGKPIVHVRGVVEKGLSDADAEDLMILLNTHRKVQDRVSLAQQLKRYLSHNHTEAEAKVTFGYKPHEFRVLMDIMQMGEPVQEALRGKKVTLEIARTLAALPESKQADALTETLKEGGGRGDKATTAAAKATESRGSKPRKTVQHPKTYRQIMKAIDTVACMPNDALRTCRLEALEWAAGSKTVAWAGDK